MSENLDMLNTCKGCIGILGIFMDYRSLTVVDVCKLCNFLFGPQHILGQGELLESALDLFM